MFLVRLPDAVVVLTMSLMYGTIASLYTFKGVVGIRSSSHDFGGVACSMYKISQSVTNLKLVCLSMVSNADSK